MAVHFVGVGGVGVAARAGDFLKTMALGSCVAVVAMDPAKRLVGMVHVALPDSTIDPAKAKDLPGYFADTGIGALLSALERAGFQGDGRSLIVKIAGGAAVTEVGANTIGKRNILAVKKHLWERRMGAVAEDVGGKLSRTVEVAVSEGRVFLSCPGRGIWEI